MVYIQNLYSGYMDKDVIKNLSMAVNKKEILCVLGPNGCGKSTLLKTIANILKYRGSIVLDGKELSSLSTKAIARKIAFMGQLSNVHFPFTVYETVALGRYYNYEGFLKEPQAQDKALILEGINKLGLYEVKDRMITELSGGQLQRVFLARTLVQGHSVILLDEPTNHLDLKHQIEVLNYFKDWVVEGDRAVIAVLHDLNMASYFCDTAALMQNGSIIAFGASKDVLNGKAVEAVYGIDVKKFMNESLGKWQ